MTIERNKSEFKLNENLIKFLEIEGIIDRNDGEIDGEVISCRDTFQNFKDGCFSFKGTESEQFGGQQIKILRNFQARKGDVRKNLFFINFGDDSQNLVIIN
jgi:hypothetical protein